MKLLCCLVLFSLHASSQNLLMNSSFEDENICTEYLKNCAPEGWISTSLWGDYYFDDPPHAFQGEHFVGLMFSVGNIKNPKSFKFIRSRLLCALREGAQYKLQFYIRSVHSQIDSVGIYFSEDDILYRQKPVNNDTPQLWVKDVIYEEPAGNWQKLEFNYTATGKENFIAIGDFKKTPHRFSARPDREQEYYFFIDLISLTATNPNESLCDESDYIREEEYNFNPRHNVLDKLIYNYRKSPPYITPLSKTIVHRVDTVLIPDVLFATNSFALNKQANMLLDSVIALTRGRVDSIVVEGHTDNVGNEVANQKLSENRAEAVRSYLNSRNKTRIISRGWASSKPVADNKTPAGRQKNRRVEIYFYVRD